MMRIPKGPFAEIYTIVTISHFYCYCEGQTILQVKLRYKNTAIDIMESTDSSNESL